MHRLLSIVTLLFIFFLSCNNRKQEEKVTYTSEDGKTQGTVDVSKMEEVVDDLKNTEAGLEKLTPLSSDALKALIPEKLYGAERTNLEVNSSIGTGVASATFRVTDTSSIELMIIDCGGPGGSGVYSLQYVNLFNIQSEDEDEYTRTIEFNGGKAFENCQKARVHCVLTYFAGGRFLVSLDGEGVGIEDLKKAAKELKL
jgi:hypothetical protein